MTDGVTFGMQNMQKFTRAKVPIFNVERTSTEANDDVRENVTDGVTIRYAEYEEVYEGENPIL